MRARIGSSIAVRGIDDNIARSLEIIKNIAIKNEHNIPAEIAWAIEEMSAELVDESIKIIESWLTECTSEIEKIYWYCFLYPSFARAQPSSLLV